MLAGALEQAAVGSGSLERSSAPGSDLETRFNSKRHHTKAPPLFRFPFIQNRMQVDRHTTRPLNNYAAHCLLIHRFWRLPAGPIGLSGGRLRISSTHTRAY